ncbi:hypothetical protein [Mycobacterium sp. ITM-2016-00318]|uniref:hypothetical protein n=1 Tax=Mycobacterium sp. ITM-2016-00318 TaxID=2099693 RepID=UPI000CF983FA|nr:hypothetical protein [Mycobacterium sp. ITM-2016-00318]WNG95279.1 hypothetical protein C6A82_013095 [Mycobacterium sp. ITM-2016-00318]
MNSGGGAAKAATGDRGSAGAASAGPADTGRGTLRITTLRVAGAEDTRGRFAGLPVAFVRGVLPPPPVAVTPASGTLASERIAAVSETPP